MTAPPFHLPPPLARMTRSGGGCIPIRSTKEGAAAPGLVEPSQDGRAPDRAAPFVLSERAVFATHPRRGEYSRPPVAPAVIAPPHRFARRGRRIQQDSPSSLWEGVSKFHYPPRCPRARSARAGSKVGVDRSASLSITSCSWLSWRRTLHR